MGRYLQRITYKMVREKIDVPVWAKKKISHPKDAAQWFRELEGSDREKFVVVCLDNRNRINCFDVVSVGSLNASIVHPREVFKAAILSNSSAVVLLHNHPSGNPEPSREDIELTRQLVRAGEIMGTEVYDHIVVGFDGEYYSFKQKGII